MFTLLVIILLIIVIYKIILLSHYKSLKDYNPNNIFGKELNIKNKTNNNEDNFYEMFFQNLSNTFEKKVYDENHISFKNENEVIAITKQEQLYKNLYTNLTTLDTKNSKINFIDKKSNKLFLEKNNIKNDIDLFNYIKNKNNKKLSIFTMITTIKREIAIKSITEIILYNEITLINNDLNGYIINQNYKTREVHILNNDTDYIIYFTGENVTSEQYIMDFLSTINFKGDTNGNNKQKS